MIDETLDRIENRLRNLESLDADKKRELANLVSKLKAEVVELSQTHAEHAESITRFADLSAHEATRQDFNQDLRDISSEGLSTSVKGFEASHPKLVDIVNAICTQLAHLGI